MNRPIVKLTVEGMRHQILHHLGGHHEEISEMVEKEIEQAIKSFSFEHHVVENVHTAIDRGIKEYFAYGPGGKIINSAIEEAMKNLFAGKKKE